MSEPLVSILIPALNAAPFIGEALASCHAQGTKFLPSLEARRSHRGEIAYQCFGWEAIVAVDPATIDSTLRVAGQGGGRWDGGEVLVTPAGPRSGYGRTFNAALAAARGDFIARLDADDWMHPEKLALQVAYLQKHPKVDLVTCEMQWVDEAGTPLESPTTGPMDRERYLSGAMVHGPPTPTILARREVYDRVGGFREDLNPSNDTEWDLRVLDAGFTWGHLADRLYYYRRHPGQMTGRFDGHAVYLTLLRERGIHVDGC